MIDVYSLFQKAQLRAGMHVADFGCGRTGHLVVPAARTVTERGIVYAVDIMKNVLQDLDKRVHDMGFSNIHVIWSDLERMGSTAILENSLDIGFLTNALVQADDRHAFLDEVCRLLKPKSRIVIVDWIKKGLTFGPESSRFVDFMDVISYMKKKGFILQEDFSVGNFHHGLVLYRPG